MPSSIAEALLTAAHGAAIRCREEQRQKDARGTCWNGVPADEQAAHALAWIAAALWRAIETAEAEEAACGCCGKRPALPTPEALREGSRTDHLCGECIAEGTREAVAELVNVESDRADRAEDAAETLRQNVLPLVAVARDLLNATGDEDDPWADWTSEGVPAPPETTDGRKTHARCAFERRERLDDAHRPFLSWQV